MKVIDLHSDLLSYLAHKEGRTPLEPASRSSHPQLQAGNVILQTLAIFSTTSTHSVKNAEKQLALFRSLPEHYPHLFTREPITESPLIHLIAAFENASTFALEAESLEMVFVRLQHILKMLGRLFYISLTWDGENRFGGGVGSTSGLKQDGKRLLEWLNGKRIAVDLSHTSDRLATEIIESIDKEGWSIPLIASHSNFRQVTDKPRNLPIDIAKEIIRRQGLIGLNLCAPFIHKTDPTTLIRHIEYALSLGAENNLCFGADFFCDTDFDHLKTKYSDQPLFFEQFGNASTYPDMLQLMRHKLGLREQTLEAISHTNAQRFLTTFIL